MKLLSLAPLAGDGLARLRAMGELELDPWNSHTPLKFHAPAELAARLEGVDVLLVEADHVSAEVLEAAPALRILGCCRGDPVNVDIPAATKRGIAVLNAPARNDAAVAELTVGMIISLVRGISSADRELRAGTWVIDGRIPQQRYLARELSSLTIGLVGCGAVGRATGSRLAALGARVIAYDPYAPEGLMRARGIEPVSLGDLLARSDVVSVHALLTEQTRGMLGPAEFERMRPGAWFVNTARFGIADGDALVSALKSGRLAGAALDHFENEILSPDHPLCSMPNVLLTPHLGGSTVETIERHTAAMADGIEALLAGREPPNTVNPEALPAFFERR